ncbi:MAG: tetratricopeptide repeat protein, partial [Verrucomicrobia bacterium]|nr:tetratricopeptide repeat protein [Verrucomicrobiota bacterium]
MPPENTEQRKLAAIMFTDMVGYSALAQRNEALALELLEEHRRLVRPIFARHGGREIKTIGDAFMVEFASPVEAARCAIAMQQILHEHNTSATPERQLRIRIGLHLGDVVHRDGDVYGDGVNIAARIEPLAEPGGICLTQQVFDQIHNKIPEPLRKLGQGELNNIQMPVNIYRVVLPWEARCSPALERMRFRLRQKKVPALAVAMVALALAGVIWATMHRIRAVTRADHSPPAVPEAELETTNRLNRLVVLALKNLSGDSNQQYFAEGITDVLSTELGGIRPLKVRFISAADRVAFAAKPVSEIARALKVDAVVRGSVQTDGKRAIIAVQLIDAATENTVLSTNFNRDLSEGLKLQIEVAQAVAREVVASLAPEQHARLANARRVNPEAYLEYFRGRLFWSKRGKEDLEKALEHFQKAISIDATYAEAWSGVADAYSALGYRGFLSPKDTFPKAEDAAKQALAKDPNLAEVHTSLGLVQVNAHDWQGAEKSFQQALKLNPSYAHAAHWYSHLLVAQGRMAESLQQSLTALDLAPVDMPINNHLVWHYLMAGNYEQARVQGEVTRNLGESLPLAHFFLGSAYRYLGRYEDAIRELSFAASRGSVEVEGELGFTYARAGNRAEARKILERFQQRSRNGEYVAPFFVALVYTGLGDRAAALDWLEKAAEDKSAWLIYLKVEPMLESPRNDPRFRVLLKQWNL